MSKYIFLGLLFFVTINYFLKYYFPNYIVELNYTFAAILFIFSSYFIIKMKKYSTLFKVSILSTFVLYFVFLLLAK